MIRKREVSDTFMAEQKKEYAAVDIFKMFCAFLVMLIHTKPFDSVFLADAALGIITRFAVPFFFTTAGYFFYKKLSDHPEESVSILKGYLLRLFRFYAIWFLIFRVQNRLMSGGVKSLPFYVKQFFFTTDGSPLWFVPALIWAIILVYLLSRFMKPAFVFLIGMLCLLIGYTFSTLLGITENSAVFHLIKPFTDFIGIQGGLFFAFPYTAMGALLSTVRIRKQHRKDSITVMLFLALLSVESLVAVTCLKAPLTFLWLSAVPMTWFVTRLMISVELREKKIYYYIRKTSTLFYVMHVIILKAVRYFIERSGIADRMHIILTMFTFMFTMIACLSVLWISGKKKFSWVKYLM